MPLTTEQKKNILITFFNTIIEERDRDLDLRTWKELENEVIPQIPANELYGLIKDIYPSLNSKHHFDKKPLGHHRAGSFAWAIKGLVENYHSIEVQDTIRKARISTILFCLFIITIPFAILFYNKKIRDYHKEQVFQSLFVEQGYLDCANKVDPIEDKVVPGNSYKKVYGLINKTIRNECPDFSKPFADVLFNEKGQIVEQLVSARQDHSGVSGINLVGSKEQISDMIFAFRRCKEKVEQADEDYDAYKP